MIRTIRKQATIRMQAITKMQAAMQSFRTMRCFRIIHPSRLLRAETFLFAKTLLLAAAILFLPASLRAASPSADHIFPDSTKGFLSVARFSDLTAQWKKTPFGQFIDDPLLENFKKALQEQVAQQLEKTFGLTFDTISTLPTGEVAFGMIAVPNQIPGYVLTMDVAGKRSETNEYLSNFTQKLVTLGVKKSAETYKEQQITVLVFPPAAKPPVLTTPGGGVITFEPTERRAYYMFHQDVLIASDQLHLLQLIADRLAGQTAASAASPSASAASPLASTSGYQTVMQRCLADMPQGALPEIRWYLEPLEYGESIRVLMKDSVTQSRRSKPSIFSILKQNGFDALHGIGGVVSMKAEGHELVHRTFAYTTKPYRLAMQMLNFPDQTNFTPPAWMPSDLARCTMLYVEPESIFDNVGVLFDAFMEDAGMWKEIMEALEKDPLGPRINIREELIVHLGNRVLGMSRYEKPITVNSEAMTAAVELKPGRESAMKAGLEKLFGTDPEFTATEHRSYTIWHRRPAGEDEVYVPPVIEGVEPVFGQAAPAVSPEHSVDDWGLPPSLVADVHPAIILGQRKPAIEEEDAEPLFPEVGWAVAKETLFISTNVEYLKTILDRLDSPPATIGSEPEFQSVERVFSEWGVLGKPHFFQFFARTHETMRPTYEMIRQGKMGQSQALLGKLLNKAFESGGGTGERSMMLDGSSLPEFERVEHYFGTLGIYGTSEQNGYFIKGFMQGRK